jgi:hypothetical protein
VGDSNPILQKKQIDCERLAKDWGQTYTFDGIVKSVGLTPRIRPQGLWVKLYLCHRYSGKKLREIGKRFGVSELRVTQASRRIQLKQKNDKKFGKLIAKTVKTLSLSNV